MTSDSAHAGRKGPLERFLSLFADVRPGEPGTALLLMLNVFLLLTCYYIIKPVREALILATEGGPELKAYMSFFQGLLLLVVVPLYGMLARKMSRRRLINVVTVFFAACLVAFFVLSRTGLPLGVVFYLWVGIFNLMVIAQFWAFANDVYTEDQGKRLFAIVGFGASIGAVLGSAITEKLLDGFTVPLAGVAVAPLNVYQLLILSAVLLTIAMGITNVVDARERRREGTGTVATREDEPITTGGPLRAFQLVIGERYLLMIALLILVLNWVNTTGEYILSRLVSDAASAAVADGTAGGLSQGEWIGRFYSGFFKWVNIAGVVIQLFLVSRVLKYLGVRVALMILPVIALGGYLMAAVVPVLAYVRWIKTAENATDYSLQNTLRGVLFLPTTREQKYMAKQAIDTIFVRAGDALQALTVFLGTTFLGLGTRGFAIFNVILVVIWLVLALRVGRQYGLLGSAERSESPVIETARRESIDKNKIAMAAGFVGGGVFVVLNWTTGGAVPGGAQGGVVGFVIGFALARLVLAFVPSSRRAEDSDNAPGQ